MLLIIPVSQSDKNLIPHFTSAVKRFGNIKNHDVVVLSTPMVTAEAGELAGEMDKYASSSKLVKLDIEPQGGWPTAPNLHFMHAWLWCMSNKITTPWFWMELDCTPLKEGWADALESEHRESRKLFMGAVVPTIKIRNPNTPQAEPFQDGTHMVGAGIYPPRPPDWCIFWRYPNGGVPFDVEMQFETCKSLHATDLIQHQFRTGNFHMDGDYIVGEDLAKSPGVDFSGRISDKAVVHHGCKDGSLSKILCETKDTKLTDVEVLQPLKAKPSKQPKPQVEVDSVL